MSDNRLTEYISSEFRLKESDYYFYQNILAYKAGGYQYLGKTEKGMIYSNLEQGFNVRLRPSKIEIFTKEKKSDLETETETGVKLKIEQERNKLHEMVCLLRSGRKQKKSQAK